MSLRPLSQSLIHEYTTAGMWQDKALYAVVDAHAARDPGRIAVADQHERLTYAELVRRSHNVAAWLLRQGLTSGDAVGLQATNRNALALMHLACDRADLVCVPLSSAYRERELGQLLKVSEAKLLFVPAATATEDYLALVGRLRADLPDLRMVGVLEGGGGDMDLSVISTEGDNVVSVDRDPNAPRYIMVTSGTTDLPKISLWTDNNLWSFMKHYRESVAMTADDVCVGLAPANTGATGYVFPVLAPLLSGATSVLLENWDTTHALELIEAEKATMACAVPTQILKLLADNTVASRDFSRLRVFTNAGAAMPPESAKEMEEVFGCICQVVYGATDGGVPFMTNLTDPPEKRWGTIGRVAPFGEVRLLSPNLKDVEMGESGEIVWRSPTKTFGYMNDPERTEAAWFEDGWYLSGDLGQFDADGYLTIIGRAKDMIIRGGQNISPRELEEVIISHPAVAEVSVIGIADPVYGERTCACVVLRSGFSVAPEELCQFMLDQGMAKFKLPERVEYFDSLPVGSGGKITKVELRGMVQERIASAT